MCYVFIEIKKKHISQRFILYVKTLKCSFVQLVIEIILAWETVRKSIFLFLSIRTE